MDGRIVGALMCGHDCGRGSTFIREFIICKLRQALMIKTIKPNSDFIIYGSLSANKIVNQIMEQILKLEKC